jgi:hypothetical protein
MVELSTVGVPVDEIILANKLKDAGTLDAIGGHAYLYEIKLIVNCFFEVVGARGRGLAEKLSQVPFFYK